MIHHKQRDLGEVGSLTITFLQLYCWVSLEISFKIDRHLAK